MPRAESKHLGTQFYHSQFSNSPYLQDNSPSTPPSPPASTASSQSAHQAAPAAAAPKKKHVCSTCDRAFTTSGHLARHSRVHTGERNHKCPFPGCETRCSRQDNLQQHYRIHLSPGSRRSSARNAAARNMNKRGSTASTVDSPSAPPALSTPPALEPARVYNHHSTPPDSPPPLAQATLPATASLLTASRMESSSNRSSPSSPDTPYASGSHMVPLSSQGMSLSPNAPQGYSYRSGTTTYQEQSQGAGFTYVHTTPITQSSSSYSSHDGFSNHSMSARDQQNSLPSRHSISHISHPQTSYPQQGSSSSTTPPSPSSSHSVSSHTSGPPTPTYPGFHDEGRAYHPNGMMNNNGNHLGGGGGGAGGASHSNGVVTHNGYSSNHVQDNGNGRFNSPPPTLAPIQNERFIRRDEHPSGHSDSSYIHHPQPMSTEYGYHHQSLALSHGAWKAENGMRKGVGAAIV